MELSGEASASEHHIAINPNNQNSVFESIRMHQKKKEEYQRQNLR